MHFIADLFSTKVAYASLDTFLANVNETIINPLIELLFALALVYFLWGVFEFMANQSNEEKKTLGKSHMMWGVIGLVIMLGVWGILGFITETIGVSDQVKIQQDGDNSAGFEIDLKEFHSK